MFYLMWLRVKLPHSWWQRSKNIEAAPIRALLYISVSIRGTHLAQYIFLCGGDDPVTIS
jgi:hypothetical protein